MGDLPLWANAVLFALSAAAIWWAGTRLEHRAATLAKRTGMGEAFAGMLLLAVATSLPEVATTVTAVAILHNPTLAVHNLLGAMALQLLIIAIADAATRRRTALTAIEPTVVLLIQGVGLLLLLQLTIAGIAARGVPVVFATSGWLVLLLLVYLATMYLVYRSRRRPRWEPTRKHEAADGREVVREAEDGKTAEEEHVPHSTGRLLLAFAGLALLVLGGGVLASQTAEALAEQTGVGSAFLGATLLAAATSLPELSTTLSAVRNERFTSAIANVFGSGSFNVTLLLLADLLYREGAVLAHAQPSVTFVATIGAMMTCLYLWGLIERENRTFLRLGWDSVAAALIYAGGMVVLYFIQ